MCRSKSDMCVCCWVDVFGNDSLSYFSSTECEVKE